MPSTLDLDARYKVEGYGGIAFYALGFATEMTEACWTFVGEDGADTEDEANYVYDEPEEIEDTTRVRVVMVGDDAVHVVDADDLTAIHEDDYCHECGQIGCTADGRER